MKSHSFKTKLKGQKLLFLAFFMKPRIPFFAGTSSSSIVTFMRMCQPMGSNRIKNQTMLTPPTATTEFFDDFFDIIPFFGSFLK